MSKNKITFKAIKLNEPSPLAVENLNRKIFEMIMSEDFEKIEETTSAQKPLKKDTTE